MTSHLDIIKGVYAAFGRQDIGHIVSVFSAGPIVWKSNAEHKGSQVPWHISASKREDIPKFFQSLVNMDLHKLEIKDMAASNDRVYVWIHIDYTVKKNGQKYVGDGIHTYVFNDKNEVVEHVEFVDDGKEMSLWNA